MPGTQKIKIDIHLTAACTAVVIITAAAVLYDNTEAGIKTFLFLIPPFFCTACPEILEDIGEELLAKERLFSSKKTAHLLRAAGWVIMITLAVIVFGINLGH